MTTERPIKKYLPIIIVAIVLYSLFAALTMFVASGATGAVDSAIEQTVYGWRSPGLNTLLEAITYCGNTASIIPLTLVLLALPQTRIRYGLPVFIADVLTTAIKVVVKNLIARPRPDAIYFLVPESGYSFPSGHSITSIAVYGMLAWLIWYYHKTDAAVGTHGLGAEAAAAAKMPAKKRALMILCAFLSVAIGLSRIYVGVHHPTDVLGGFLAGIATALLVLMAVVQTINSGVRMKVPLTALGDAADTAAAANAAENAAAVALADDTATEPAAPEEDAE
jgi:undecaprenyl-diphosphatase